MSLWSGLHSTAFILQIRPGQVAEYRRRHDALWPEMREALLQSGIVHYDIHLHEESRRVFGHVLREQPPDPTAPEHPVILRWRAHMADVLEMEGERPRREPLERVFHLTA